jgi:hypothetical protein
MGVKLMGLDPSDRLMAAAKVVERTESEVPEIDGPAGAAAEPGGPGDGDETVH